MSSSRPTAARLHPAWAIPLGAVVALTLAGCGGAAASAKAPAAAPSAAASAGARPGGGNQADRGGVRGTIAAVTGQVMQLQDASSQTAVAWTSSTTITQEVAGTLADVTPGVCVLALTAGSGTAGAAGSGAATSVTVTQPVDGSCTAGFGGGGGATGGAMPGGRPTGAPGNGTRPSGAPGYGTRPSGAPTGGAGGFARPVDGLVTAVSGSTITVQTRTGATGGGSTGTPSADASTGTGTVTVDAATTYLTTKAADASAIVVGQCATARGTADSTGKVAATSIQVSAPTNGSCVTASRAFGGNRAGQGGQPQQGAPTTASHA